MGGGWDDGVGGTGLVGAVEVGILAFAGMTGGGRGVAGGVGSGWQGGLGMTGGGRGGDDG